MAICRLRSAGLIAAGLLAGGVAAGAAGPARAAGSQAAPLRVCADPDNPPFSSKTAQPPGLYVEVGRMLATRLGREFDPVWTLSYFGKHTVRTTLLDGKCDAYVGLPPTTAFMGPRIIYSRPFLNEGFALVVPKGASVRSLADLDGKRVAVQFSTPPESLLADRPGVKSVTFLNPEKAMAALERHRVDAAFVWGPSAGYINSTELHGAYRVIPVAGKGMQWRIAVGFTRDNAALRDQVDQALAAEAPQIQALAAKYGFPTATPVELAAAAAPDPSGSQEATPSPTPAKAEQAAANPEAIAAGREIFNRNCAACHGRDAVQPVPTTDLRLLRKKSGGGMEQSFLSSVTQGVPGKGMPGFAGKLSQSDLEKVLAFVNSVQQPG